MRYLELEEILPATIIVSRLEQRKNRDELKYPSKSIIKLSIATMFLLAMIMVIGMLVPDALGWKCVVYALGLMACATMGECFIRRRWNGFVNDITDDYELIKSEKEHEKG